MGPAAGGATDRGGGQEEVSSAMDWLVGSSRYQFPRHLEIESSGGCGKCSGLGGFKDKNRDE